MNTISVPTSFNVFDSPPTDGAVEEIIENEILPLSGTADSTVLEYVIQPDSSEFMDLSSLRMYVQISITASDDSPLKDDDKLELCSCWPQAMIKQLDLYLNQKVVSHSSNNYAYRAMFENILSFSKATKSEIMNAAEHYNGLTITKTKNRAEAYFPLHLDLCNQASLLIPGVEVRLRALRNNPNFFLTKKAGSTESFRVKIEKASVRIKKIRPNPSFLADMTTKLSKTNAKYYIDKAVVKNYNITKGHSDATISNLFLGDLPGRIFVAFVNSDSYNADLKTDPFSFCPYDVSHVSLLCNGNSIPRDPFQPNFDQGLARREFIALYEAVLGDNLLQDNIGLTFEDFIKDKCFFAFTMANTPGGPTSFIPRPTTGYINLRLKFKKPLEDNITVLVYGEYQSTIHIDSNRNVYH